MSNGYQTIDIWDRLTDGTWIPNAFLDTGSAGWTPGVPQCDADGSTSAQDVPTTANGFFNRNATARWGLAHAQDLPDDWWKSSGCTWFVSQALWAGGFPQDDTWTSEGQHGRVRQVQGSVAAWAAPEFLDHLKSSFDVRIEPLDFHANSVPDAAVGDVIAYDWDGDGAVDHLALVTAIADGQYPLVSEWGVGTSILGHFGAAEYQTRGWTYSDNSDHWLQKSYPNVQATLYHINGGYLVGTF